MLLSYIIFLPLCFAGLIWLYPSKQGLKPLALVLSLVEFLVSLLIFKYFDPSSASIQLSEVIPWIERYGISYFVGIDGISIWLVILSTFLMPLVLVASWNSIEKNIKGYLINIFVLQATMIGTFLALDVVLFYIFFELSLIPMYFIVGIWGGPRRIYATMKFFIYTMVGSVFMLIAIISLMFMTEYQLGTMSASLIDMLKLEIPFIGSDLLNTQTLLFIGFSLAFAIKVPLFPVHTWLPDAHVEAPTAGSVVLAGVMLKMGTYGFVRFVIPLFPEAVQYWAWVFLFLGTVGIIYGALVAMVQPDIKKLVAYSSVSHMGYVMIGLFALNSAGITGGIYQMLNHGISTGALFILVGMIYDRTHSRNISQYGGLASAMPIFAIVFLIVTMSSIAVPGTNGFIGEFLILFGTFQTSKIYGVFAVTGVVLGAAYMLWMYKKVFFGGEGELVADSEGNFKLSDLSFREILVISPLVLLIFWMGVFPNHFLNYSKTSIDNLVKNKSNYELTVIRNNGSYIVSESKKIKGAN